MPSAIIVLTCLKFWERAKACQETWAASSPIPVHFLTGADLDTPDDYWSLPAKMIAACRWALDHGFDRIYKADDDVYVQTKCLELMGDCDYSGHFRDNNPGPSYASGFFYMLGKKSMEIVAASEPIKDIWAEDMMVGQHLKEKGGIDVIDNHRCLWFFPESIRGRNFKRLPTDFIACGDFRPDVLRQFHQLIESGRFWDTQFLKTLQLSDWDDERRKKKGKRHAK